MLYYSELLNENNLARIRGEVLEQVFTLRLAEQLFIVDYL